MTTIILLLIAAAILVYGVGQWFKLAWDYGSRATSTGPKPRPIAKKPPAPPSGNLWN